MKNSKGFEKKPKKAFSSASKNAIAIGAKKETNVGIGTKNSPGGRFGHVNQSKHRSG